MQELGRFHGTEIDVCGGSRTSGIASSWLEILNRFSLWPGPKKEDSHDTILLPSAVNGIEGNREVHGALRVS